MNFVFLKYSLSLHFLSRIWWNLFFFCLDSLFYFIPLIYLTSVGLINHTVDGWTMTECRKYIDKSWFCLILPVYYFVLFFSVTSSISDWTSSVGPKKHLANKCCCFLLHAVSYYFIKHTPSQKPWAYNPKLTKNIAGLLKFTTVRQVISINYAIVSQFSCCY